MDVLTWVVVEQHQADVSVPNSTEINKKQQLLNATGQWLCLVPTMSDNSRFSEEISRDFTLLYALMYSSVFSWRRNDMAESTPLRSGAG